MSSRVYRQQLRALQSENKRYGKRLIEIGPDQWPAGHPPNLIKVLRNKDYLLQIYEEASNLIRLSITRTMINADLEWQDGITWEQLQALKDEAGFDQCDAVEVFPRKDDVVNAHNVRHLWVLAHQLPFVWRSEPERVTSAVHSAEAEHAVSIPSTS